jgi:thiosulfate dehydrogenase
LARSHRGGGLRKTENWDKSGTPSSQLRTITISERDKEIGTPSPIPVNEANLLAGAKIYQVQCLVCHGQLGQPEFFIAKGMFPHPPQLLPPKRGVTNDLVGEIYWKVKNGIRLTGMPGYVDNLTDTEMWQVSLLLHQANKLPESVQQVMRK